MSLNRLTNANPIPVPAALASTAEQKGSLSFSLLQGQQALEWSRGSLGNAAWQRLFADCPWATAFQSMAFFDIWSRHYASVWSPLLVVGQRADGVVAGIMPLAIRNGLVVGVGSHQAEYQGWISRENDASEFIVGALDAIAASLPRHQLRLRYLPHAVPKSALQHLRDRNPRVTLHHHVSHELLIDPEAIGHALKKKSNRSKVHRLQRLGELQFRLLNAQMAAAEFDRIVAMYDFRQGALNDVCPFLDDPVKRAFHLDWLNSCPRQLYVSGMFLKGQMIAALMFVRSKTDLHLAISAHAPNLAEHSPNKLNIYESALALVGDGATCIDLTPGGDAWKARFSTGQRDVWELIMHESALRSATVRAHVAVRAAVRRVLSTVGVSIPTLNRRIKAIGSLVGGARVFLGRRAKRELLYHGELRQLERPSDIPVLLNPLEWLIRSGPLLRRRRRQLVLSEALSRIERGDLCYAVSGPGANLSCVGWTSWRSSTLSSSAIARPHGEAGNTALLHDFFVGRDVSAAALEAMIERMLADVAQRGKRSDAFIAVPLDSAALNDAVKRRGFKLATCSNAHWWERSSTRR